MLLASGTVVDERYAIEAHLGAGGFGQVYAARRLAVGDLVALKVLRLERALPHEHAERLEELLEEARILARLNDVHIVEALDAGTFVDNDVLSAYVALELCSGITLRNWLAGRGPLSLDDAIDLIETLTRAIAHAHDQGVAHRDLKPSNIMVDDDGRPESLRVLDFGIAKALHADAGDGGSGETRTASPSSPHTPSYAAPEQVVGARTGPWTDVHAIGLIFVELVTGRRPYGASPAEEAAAPNRPSPRERGVDVGPFEAVIARALVLRPRERYRDARALHAALCAAATESGRRVNPIPAAPSVIAGTPAPPELGPASETIPSARSGGSAGWVRSTSDGATRVLVARVPVWMSRRRLLTVGAIAGLTATAGGALVFRDERLPRRPADLDFDEIEARVAKACGRRPSDFRRHMSSSRGVSKLRSSWGLVRWATIAYAGLPASRVSWGTAGSASVVVPSAPSGVDGTADWTDAEILHRAATEESEAAPPGMATGTYIVGGEGVIVVAAPTSEEAQALIGALVEGLGPRPSRGPH